MENIIVKGTNWIKGFALLGMMVALVGMLAVAPGASAASATDPVPSSGVGKLTLVAIDQAKDVNVMGATVAVYNVKGEIVLKGQTDANGNFASYIASGSYKVKVFADGFKEFSQYATITTGNPTFVKAGLEPNSKLSVSNR